MTTRTATCQCGGLTATCEGEPNVVSLCSCLDCQRRTGSAFCPACGSTVYWQPHARPEIIGVAVGAFADPTFPKPIRTVYDEHRHPWIGFEAATRL